MSSLSLGHILNGTYEIRSTLGKGGFGITYHGVDRYLASEVAIKEFFPWDDEVSRLPNNTVVTCSANKASFEWGLDGFLKEARIIAKLKHPNIIQVQTFFKENGTAYLVMPFAQGTPPEQYGTEGKQGAWSDIYAKGGSCLSNGNRRASFRRRFKPHD